MAVKKTHKTTRKPLRKRPRERNRLWLGSLVSVFVAAGLYLALQRDASTSAVESVDRPDVVLISIDTLRADYLGCYGSEKAETPHLDALASEGVRFETVVSEVPLTLPAHCSLLTGTYPMTTGVHDNLGYTLSTRHWTLAEILRRQGYSTAAFVGAYVLDSKWGLDQGFDHYDDDLQSGRQSREEAAPVSSAVERRGGQVSEAAVQWLNARGRQPFFCWIHLFDPHDPYEPPEPYRSRYARDPYAGEVAYADEIVGEILQSLRKLGRYDQSLVIVVGDHGESLGEHRELTHGYFLYDATLLVPLIVKLPQSAQAPRATVVQGIVQLVDVVPTILQILEVVPPAALQGQGLLAAMLGKRDLSGRRAYSETYYPNEFGWSELKAWRTPDYKYILGPRPELYALPEDAHETHNVIGKRTALANQLRAQLLAFEERYRDREAAAEAQTQLTQEDLERLQSLGYIGGPSPGRVALESSLPDPKDKVEQYSLISQAMTLIARREFEQALPILNELLQRDPSIVSVYSMLGQCYLRMGRFRAAQNALEKVVRAEPSRIYPRLALAQACYHQKDYDRARSLMQEVLQRDPDSFTAYHYLGLIYSDRDEIDRAVESFSKAIAIREDAGALQMLGYLYTKDNQPQKAAWALERAVRLQPDNALAHLYLANAYMLQGKRAQGEAEYRKALELDPDLAKRIR